MSRTRRLIAFGGTFSVALGIGFVMQNGDALADRFGGGAEDQAVVADVTPTAAQTQAPAEAGLVTLGGESAGNLELASLEIDPVATEPMSVVEGELDLSSDACLPEMIATPMPGAMVNLTLMAPCHGDALATIHHSGIMFNVETNANGAATVSVPALAADALFMADMSEGVGAMAIVEVPEVVNYERSVVQWQGPEGLFLHAMEDGASYGDPGHVWADAPRTVDAAMNGQGYMTVLGSGIEGDPMRVQVYSRPAAAGRGAPVHLTVEAAITEANCGQTIDAQTIQIMPGTAPMAIDMSMTLAGCDAAGQFLVLSNMLQDLTLASR